MKFLTLVFSFFLFNFNCEAPTTETAAMVFSPSIQKMRGISLVAPSRPFPADPMGAVKAVGADWITVIPYAFSPNGQPNVYFDSDRQWWGERPEGATETIRLAQQAGLKVMLKPQVWIHNGWVGGMDFEAEEDWAIWEKDYRTYILAFAKIAESSNVKAFCIGTEFKIAVQKREKFWRQLIKDVRAIYSGKLTYAANWDEYELVKFWKELDYIGVDAYFPLVNKPTPSVEALKKAWQPIFKQLKAFSKKMGKPMVFTEYGYLSLDGCAYNTWELEKKRSQTPINEKAQANAIDAMMDVFWKEDWWGGGFIWKWYPNYQKGEGRRAKFRAGDYTPQGKLGEEILKKWYAGAKE